MRSNFKRLGNYIEAVNKRNSDCSVTDLRGLSLTKEFRSSTSNIVGTDMSTYKVMHKYDFAANFMGLGVLVDKAAIVLKKDETPNIVSGAYPVFRVKDENILHPEYLMMWLIRSEFDRYCVFKSDKGIRGGFDWNDLLETEFPIPSITKQREIVKEYNTIQNRIELNQQIIQKLEEAAQSIYKEWFIEDPNENWEEMSIGELCTLITDGKHGDCQNEVGSGYYFVSVKDLINGDIFYDNVRQITKHDFQETHNRTDLKPGDILLTSSGTIGRMMIVKEDPKTYRTTLQKSVAVLKPKIDIAPSYYLFSLLNSEMKSIIDLAGGSTIANLLLGDLKRYKVKYPGKPLVAKYELTVAPIYKNIEFKNKECQILTKVKGLLLSKLATV